jgi:hypothetical protein
MIELHPHCKIVQSQHPHSPPLALDRFSIELAGESASNVDPAVVQHAAEAVLHYYRHEMERRTITIEEFTDALQHVLRGIGLKVTASISPLAPLSEAVADLTRLAEEAGEGFELAFFARLRDVLRAGLTDGPQLVRFRGLRRCVKQLAGARRWNGRCRRLHDQIVDYLRQCLCREPGAGSCALMVQ